ncbi:acetyltransferase (GNAT) family protein [Jatrophihabitans sp. GAS493]|uniref:GNAT family N-acetyltransferase n=1 Tax=Jatrophihabitans sp. GAS493 TaxID=1907575 RepID=UPI000BBFFA03|nr:GNAT family N-acetyltransferase [Jatrophihabitans sp. GAS493]SOD72337.1 acetyltransferase (GNAT) family protein [Jatrophihabitans sp. GAS493]
MDCRLSHDRASADQPSVDRLNFSATRDDGVQISTDPARLDLDRICDWLASSYWASERSPDDVERSLGNSYPFGVYAEGAQVALARVTSDLVSFAWIGDVFVDERWRGRRIGHWLVETVVAELGRLGVPRFVLATRDAHRVYADVGFTALRVPETWMEIDTRANRPSPADVQL